MAAAASNAIVNLLGPELVKADGSKVSTADHLAGKETVGIYFSAHWCPPCKAFTPVLSKWYTQHAAGKKAGIVFASSDRDEGQFREYLGEMSWGVALPYKAPKIADLSSKYGVRGIPTLVTVDAVTGELVSKKGREGVTSNPAGWPFKPKSMAEVMSEAKVIKGSESKTVAAYAADEGLDHVMLYFSASWCGPCKAFTPRLTKWYEAQRAAGRKLEIILVSADKTPSDFAGYFAGMPWAALDFADRSAAAELNSTLEVEGIPTLALLDAKSWEVLHADVRGLVSEAPEGFPWAPTAVSLPSLLLSKINDMKTVLLFTDKAESSTAKAEAELEAAATEYFGTGEVQFGIITSENAMAGRLRGFLGIAGDADGADSARCVMLDIPNGCRYPLADSLSAMSTDGAILEAVRGVFAGKTAPVSLG